MEGSNADDRSIGGSSNGKARVQVANRQSVKRRQQGKRREAIVTAKWQAAEWKNVKERSLIANIRCYLLKYNYGNMNFVLREYMYFILIRLWTAILMRDFGWCIFDPGGPACFTADLRLTLSTTDLLR
jgi:hypothetical protein